MRLLVCSLAMMLASVGAAQSPRVSIELADVSVVRLATVLSEQLHEPVVIDTDAESAARCAHLTLSSGGPQDVARILGLLNGALRSSGLSITRDGHGVHIAHLRGAPLPENCISTPPPDSGAQVAAVIENGIHQRGDGTYAVTRAARDAIFADQSLLLRSVRLVPQEENGHVIGMRLYGIRAHSLAGLLGAQNGDLLRRVAGHDITTDQEALQAYSQARTAERFDIELTRRGQPLTLHYLVTDR